MYHNYPYQVESYGAKKLPPFIRQLRARYHVIIKKIISFRYRKKHRNLETILSPLGNYTTVKAISDLYIFLYLSKSLSKKEKLEILTYHYEYLQNLFSAANLEVLFTTGIECWTEQINGNRLSIKLVHSTYLEFEGSLTLVFTMNETCIHKLSFTIVPGKYFGVMEEKIIYVSLLQGTLGETHTISEVTKCLNDLIPSTILMCVLEGIGMALGISTILGINAKKQLSYNEKIKTLHLNNYDAYWSSQGGKLMRSGDYSFSCPLECKPIENIKAKHRNRTIKKRAKRAEISTQSYNAFTPFVRKEFSFKRKPVKYHAAFFYLPTLFKITEFVSCFE